MTPRTSVINMRGKEILCQALFWQLGRFVSYEALEDLLWGNDPDGGPLNTHNIINQYVLFLRDEGNIIETSYSRDLPSLGVKMLARIAPRNLDGAHKFYLMIA